MRPLPFLLLVALPLAAFAGCLGDPAPGTPDAAREAQCVSTVNPSVNATAPVWLLETSIGTMRVTLFCDKTPLTAQNIVALTEEGFYDGTKFHRVIAGFMSQGGDPLTKDDSHPPEHWGTGGSKEIRDEFACADGTVDHTMDNPQYPGYRMRPGVEHEACRGALALKHDAEGVVSMANAGPNSGSSQFFITAGPQPGLDGAHPVFGKVADERSLEVARAINRVDTDAQDRPREHVVLEHATIDWS